MSEFKEELIVKYIENEYTKEEEQYLLDWLRQSEENVKILLTYKKIYNLKNIKYFSEPARIENAFERFTLQTRKIEKKQFRNIVLSSFKYAAVVIFLLGISAFFWFLGKEKPSEMISVTIGSSDSIRSVILPDGSKVWINNNSTFKYPITFSGKDRNVIIDGEAFFDVKKDSLRPFVVHAKSMNIKVYGTSFNVDTRSCSNSVRTTLVSGKISIQNDNGQDLAMVLPGQMAIYHFSSQKIDLKSVNTDLYTSWRKGYVIFDKAKLSEILARLQDTYHFNIILNSRKNSDLRYNFVFQKNHSIETVLEMLKFVAPIQYKIYGKEIYVNQK